MSRWTRLFEAWMNLPPPYTKHIEVENDLAITMPDGVQLKADRLFPSDGAGAWPTVLIRNPYGRKGLLRYLLAYPLARRGYHVLFQNTRGTHDAEGDFSPFHNERKDGLATVDWLEQQPWYNGQLIAYGVSYMAYATWAMAAELGDRLTAFAYGVGCSDVRDFVYMGDSFSLHDALFWTGSNADGQFEGSVKEFVWHIVSGQERTVKKAMDVLPLQDCDKEAIGRHVPFFQNWLRHSAPDDPWWAPLRFSHTIPALQAPVLMVGGWQDVFLSPQLKDYQASRDAGQQVELHIGPWNHADLQVFAYLMHVSIPWLDRVLKSDKEARQQARARLFLTGQNRWIEHDIYPPPSIQPTPWYLQPNGALSEELPTSTAADRCTYDPADPTPMVGGPSLSRESGCREQNGLEARHDILTYTSPPMERDTPVVGPLQATIYTRSTTPYFDVYVCLCTVDPTGRSINVTEGLQRVHADSHPADEQGVRKVDVDMCHAGHVFQKGHRIRVQVGGGSHPRFARNPGTGATLAEATTTVSSQRTIFHDPTYSSHISLPFQHQSSQPEDTNPL